MLFDSKQRRRTSIVFERLKIVLIYFMKTAFSVFVKGTLDFYYYTRSAISFLATGYSYTQSIFQRTTPLSSSESNEKHSRDTRI